MLAPICIILLLTAAAVRAADLADPRYANPADWLSYDRDNTGQRYSPLDQIDRSNVGRLAASWAYQMIRLPARSEATPLVRSGILYFTAGGEEAFALDARTGRELWSYIHQPGTAPDGARVRRANWNRGMAISGHRVFMATSDCHLLALDARTGSRVWSVNVRPGTPCYGTTGAPVIHNNRVLIGQRGGDIGIRGHLDAYDTETGKLAWRFHTIPAPGEKGSETWPATEVFKLGGGATWTAGTYDPGLNLLYWPTGNPGPNDYDGSNRAGDNLYTDSVVALRPDNGTLAWHFQFTPHDLWDWDANETPVLADAEFRGRPRKLLMQANRNGFFYVLDRATGEFLLAEPFARQTWAKGFTPAGRPIVNPGMAPSRRGSKVCPDVHGGTNWQPASYSPKTGLFYVVARDSCGVYYPTGPSLDTATFQPRHFLRAIEIGTGKTRWEIPFLGTQEITHAGAMSTAGGLVFFSSRDGQFMAADAESGKVLWHFNTGGTIRAGPMSYSVDGRQYVAVMTKAAVFAFALMDAGRP